MHALRPRFLLRLCRFAWVQGTLETWVAGWRAGESWKQWMRALACKHWRGSRLEG